MSLDRAQRIVNNDQENIPYGLIAMWASALTLSAGKDSQPLTHLILVILFTIARVAHTCVHPRLIGLLACLLPAPLTHLPRVTYAYKLSLLRTLSWSLGVLATIALFVNCIVSAFEMD